MKTSRKLRDVEALLYYRAVLFTAGTLTEISQALEKYGFAPDILETGKDLLEKAREIYDENLHKKDELASARLRFVRKKQEVESIFRTHRNKALLIYRNDRRVLQRLAIYGKYPNTYDLWFETLRKFYTVATTDKRIEKGLEQLRLMREELDLGLQHISELEALFAAYLKGRGESQRSTVIKNKAFNELYDWMVTFFGVARLALREKPELLAALERHVG